MKNMLESYRNTLKALRPEIDANTVKYRKGNFKITVLGSDGTPVPATVTVEQKSHKFNFGTNVLMLGAMGEKEEEYKNSITNIFNLVTTTFCWSITEINEGVFRFDEGIKDIYRRPPAERVLKFADENGLKAKGQPLLADSWYPDWASRDKETLKKQYINFFKKVSERYDGKYYLFDVVNESNYCKRRTPHFPLLEDDAFNYVKWALKTAGEIFSEKTLMERNEGTEVNSGDAAIKYYEQNKEILEEGIRLDAIGHQFHYFNHNIESLLVGEANPENLYKAYLRMSTLGVPMYITEITIPSVYENMTALEGEELQAELLESLYRLWFSIPGMQGIIYWNLKDGDAFQDEGVCRGCLVDEFLRKKKAYCILEHLIKREWNTSFKDKTDGSVEFSGFYGDYDVTIETEDGSAVKQKISFTENGAELTVRLDD